MIAANFALYSYDHSSDPSQPVRKQAIITKGGIEIENEVWIGTGVIVLVGIKIGSGAVIGAGSSCAVNRTSEIELN